VHLQGWQPGRPRRGRLRGVEGVGR
jgi:hypothetical protein